MRLGRLAKAANEQSISALEPLHTNLALSPVRLGSGAHSGKTDTPPICDDVVARPLPAVAAGMAVARAEHMSSLD